MNAKMSTILSLSLLAVGVFLAGYFATAPIIGSVRAFIIATIISFLAAIAVAVAYMLGRDTAQQGEIQAPALPTPADVARAVIDTLEASGLAYDPEAIGPRLTGLQGEVTRLANLIAALQDQIGRRSAMS